MSEQNEQPVMTGDDAAIRRVPQQRRSRQKVNKILETAKKLFQESGMDSVSMREIAREAGMAIATVYQYFPNKQSIVRRIWENYTETVDTVLETELATLLEDPSSATVQRAIGRIVDNVARSHEENPAFVEIRRCVEATPDLRELNFENTMQAAELIKRIIMGVNPQADESAVSNYAMIAIEAASSTVKLGQQMSEERRQELYTSLKAFLVRFFQSLSE